MRRWFILITKLWLTSVEDGFSFKIDHRFEANRFRRSRVLLLVLQVRVFPCNQCLVQCSCNLMHVLDLFNEHISCWVNTCTFHDFLEALQNSGDSKCICFHLVAALMDYLAEWVDYHWKCWPFFFSWNQLSAFWLQLFCCPLYSWSVSSIWMPSWMLNDAGNKDSGDLWMMTRMMRMMDAEKGKHTGYEWLFRKYFLVSFVLTRELVILISSACVVSKFFSIIASLEF